MVTAVRQGLQRATPESQGIASAAILQFVEAVESRVHELHSFMLVRHGKVVAEGWWSPYGRDIQHMLFSLSKSFTSTAVGLLVEEGRLSVDDPVLSFFPDETPADANDHLKAMQVRHLLSMSTGHDVDTMPKLTERADFNWTKGFFEVPVVHEPGTHFLYNTGATYMLAAIVQKISGQMLVDYLQPRLFEPLGIDNPIWEVSPQGINMGGFGLNITTEDIAKFGQLYLQKGQWEGRQLIPESWVAEATSKQIANANPGPDWAQGYGYQFWRCQHNGYRGDGAFGQYCVVMPEQDMVLAITSGLPDMQQPLDIAWTTLLPAMGKNPLPDDAAAQDKLAQKLANLSITPVTGKVSSAQAVKVSGKTYTIYANDLNVQTLGFQFSDAGATIMVKSSRGEETIPVGYGEWAHGQVAVFNAPWEVDPEPVVSSGAWTANDTFTAVVRFYKTPFYHTLVCRFRENRLTVETWVNVSFEPPTTVTLTGQEA